MVSKTIPPMQCTHMSHRIIYVVNIYLDRYDLYILHRYVSMPYTNNRADVSKIWIPSTLCFFLRVVTKTQACYNYNVESASFIIYPIFSIGHLPWLLAVTTTDGGLALWIPQALPGRRPGGESSRGAAQWYICI